MLYARKILKTRAHGSQITVETSRTGGNQQRIKMRQAKMPLDMGGAWEGRGGEGKGKREETLTETARRSRPGAPSAGGVPALPGRRRRRLPLAAPRQQPGRERRGERAGARRSRGGRTPPHRGMYTVAAPLSNLAYRD